MPSRVRNLADHDHVRRLAQGFFSAFSQLSVSRPTFALGDDAAVVLCTNSIGSSMVMMWPVLLALR